MTRAIMTFVAVWLAIGAVAVLLRLNVTLGNTVVGLVGFVIAFLAALAVRRRSQ